MKIKTVIVLTLLLLGLFSHHSFPLSAEETAENPQDNIVVDLKDPTLKDGVLTTEKGGIITSSKIRIQAKKIVYTKKTVDNKLIFKVEAEGDLMVEQSDRIFVGSKVEYDFVKEEGIIHEGTTVVDTWFIGGSAVLLKPDGSYTMEEGYITTCANVESEWQVRASDISVPKENSITASNIQLRFLKLPLFWIPTFHGNIKKILRAPVQWRFHFGGSQSSRIGMRYKVITSKTFKAALRLDYRFDRGIGGGVETDYHSEDGKELFFTRNYVANDSSITDTNRRKRYRFEGRYSSWFHNKKIAVDASYDRLSDNEMPSDFDEDSFDIGTAGRTEIIARRIENPWILSLLSRIRINSFQSLKQEMPTFSLKVRPRHLGGTGIITDNDFKISYLEFAFANGSNRNDFHSTRLQSVNTFYRPFSFSNLTITPNVGFTGTYYDHSLDRKERWVGIARGGADARTHLYKEYGKKKHVIEPYLTYTYFSTPKTDPDEHYIFDFDDSWYKYNLARLGIKNSLTSIDEKGTHPEWTSEIYANAILGTSGITKKVPKIYATLNWTKYRNLLIGGKTAWNLAHSELDHFNILGRWTVNADLALSAEYRTRDERAWRKADHDNYLLESFRDENTLLNSLLSDKRDTILFKGFYRFLPSWVIKLQSRHGSGRASEPNYNEYQADLVTMIRCNWRLRVTYKLTEDDQRFSFNVRLLDGRPEKESSPLFWP